MHHYPITIHQISVAPEHQVFGKKQQTPDGSDLVSKPSVQLIADSGIEGDRFCRHRPDYNGHVTFFSYEVWESVRQELALPAEFGPELTRRNIIVSGVDLKALYGKDFSISGIHFFGTVHCAPCQAMNQILGAGARAALRSRGGLRAQVKSSGQLETGKGELLTETSFDPKNAATQEELPQIP